MAVNKVGDRLLNKYLRYEIEARVRCGQHINKYDIRRLVANTHQSATIIYNTKHILLIYIKINVIHRIAFRLRVNHAAVGAIYIST